jgi:hypothetical protein
MAARCGCYVLLARHNSSHFPVSSGDGGWSLPSTHRLSASSGVHSIIHTACGRTFDPNIYQEMLTACCDQQWLQAIQRGILEDSEYVELIRTEGGAAAAVKQMSEGVTHDNEFMEKLKERLCTDRKISLSLCAMQDSYLRIRRKRDEHETRVAASGKEDPLSNLKRTKLSFGQLMPGK